MSGVVDGFLFPSSSRARTQDEFLFRAVKRGWLVAIGCVIRGPHVATHDDSSSSHGTLQHLGLCHQYLCRYPLQIERVIWDLTLVIAVFSLGN